MANLRVQRRQQKSTDRGASLVEFALILPLFVVLIFGMITGGIALSQQNSVKNAVREASRFAAVSPKGTTASELVDYLDGVIAQVEAAASGDLDNGVSGKVICAAHTTDGAVYASRTKTGSSTTSGTSACFADGLGARSRTQVVAERDAEIGAIFFTVDIDLRTQTASRYER